MRTQNDLLLKFEQFQEGLRVALLPNKKGVIEEGVLHPSSSGYTWSLHLDNGEIVEISRFRIEQRLVKIDGHYEKSLREAKAQIFLNLLNHSGRHLYDEPGILEAIEALEAIVPKEVINKTKKYLNACGAAGEISHTLLSRMLTNEEKT